MASVVFSQMGSAVGSSMGGAMGSVLGQALGSFVGQHIDNKLFPQAKHHTHGARLGDLMVQTSCYGKVIADIYGTCAIAGNVIWAAPVKENANVVRNRAGSNTNYNYSITCAIALCQGPIDGILRIWVDSKLVDTNFAKYRLYKGTEDQMPDHLIEGIEGIGKTTAFRGLAYIVIEDFPLADYNNHLPNIVFEIKRKVANDDNLEEMISNMVIIPGSGEFVYDTVIQHKLYGIPMPNGRWIQRGMSVFINNNNHYNKADALVALDQLQENCPKLKWAAPVVTWFTNSLEAGRGDILPGVEYQNETLTTPDIWSVGGFSRAGAYLISKNENNQPIYGGSVNDLSVIRYLAELKHRGLKIMLYPMIFVDQRNKPWRGRITGSLEGINEFFNKKDGYNDFILHYARLAKGRIDAFVIGSEFIGLTKVRDKNNNFPAVKELIKLARNVKQILGCDVKITYAADWSEYHHSDGGWYNLDELWACDDIDVVAIDAYFPLTSTTDIASEQDIINGWESGEGYDFYYDNQEKKPLTSAYAWKNINWWWSHDHYNPDGSKTPWVPKSKKIWFTEFGFPSVDACANQPNVFYDPHSIESFFPKYSKGLVDFQAQRTAIKASLKKWKNSEFVEEMFLWCYDARPYPSWPSMNRVWRDAGVWAYGHWVNGKLGDASLKGIVSNLCMKAGLTCDQYDCSMLNANVEGYVLADYVSARTAIEVLGTAYFFHLVEADGKLKFIPSNACDTGVIIDQYELVDVGQDIYQINKEQTINLPNKVDILFLDKVNNYKQGFENSQMAYAYGKENINISLPIVCSSNMAKQIAAKILYNHWQNCLNFSFSLSTKYSYLEPGDIITLNVNNTDYKIIICEICYAGDANILQIYANSFDMSIYDKVDYEIEMPNIEVINNDSEVIVHLLELPNSVNHSIFMAITSLSRSDNIIPIYSSKNQGNSYELIANSRGNAVIGAAINVLGGVFMGVRDDAHILEVMLINGELESLVDLKFGGNLALVGSEIIQFADAKLLGDHHYQLSGLIRGCFGTEIYINDHTEGERFILLDRNLIEIPATINEMVKYKITDQELDQVYLGSNIKPHRVVNIKVLKNEQGDLLISWHRKSRINHNNWDNEVPLLEMIEKYEVDILKNNLIIRTICSNEPFLTYNNDLISLDFNNNPNDFSLIIYQKSDLVGRGFGAKFIYRDKYDQC
jgi:DNA polymerase III delta prime subunit